MIALDTNVLVRYLVRDELRQAEAARGLLESLTSERPGYACREVVVELVWVLERAYGFPRDRIATDPGRTRGDRGSCHRGRRRCSPGRVPVPGRRRGILGSDDLCCG